MSRATTRKSGENRPLTAASMITEIADGTWTCAVIDAKKFGAGHDMGIAALDTETGVVTLTELCDTQAYVKTLHLLSLRPPKVILVASPQEPMKSRSSDADQAGPKTSMLVTALEESFDADLIGVPRSAWNAQQGASILDKLLAANTNHDHTELSGKTELTLQTSNREAMRMALSRKYFALSACCALFDYLQTSSSTVLQSPALRVRFEAPEGSIFIDPASVFHLDLVALPRLPCAQTPHSIASLNTLLNHCRTPMGARLLKMNILQPPANQDITKARHDSIEELLDAPERMHTIDHGLQRIGKIGSDMDRLLSSLSFDGQTIPPGREMIVTEQRLNCLVDLLSFLRNRPQLLEALHGARSPTFRAIELYLREPALDLVEGRIKGCINETVIEDKGVMARRESKLFAIKPDFCALLDVARATYKENVQDIFNYVEDLNAKYSLSLSLKKGKADFALELKTHKTKLIDLPSIFVNRVVSTTSAKVVMSTVQLKKLNRKVADSRDEILILSQTAVGTLCGEVFEKLPHLFKMAEAVALLDMLSSLAVQSGRKGYIRPEGPVDDAATLAVKSARHPLLDAERTRRAVPNDVFADKDVKVTILAGPNLSGKTTHLKMIGQLSVMASVGCFVPANYASFQPISAILTRFSNDDDMEHNLSTFGAEMRMSAGILALADPSTLILVDELGRGTSPNEGLSFACAITEQLARSGATVFFATHFTELLRALQQHSNVILQHLGSSASAEEASGEGNASSYTVRRGIPSSNQPYGLQTAMISRIPRSVTECALKVRAELDRADEESSQASLSRHALLRHQVLSKTHQTLTKLLDVEECDGQEGLKLLLDLQGETIERVSDDVGQLRQE